MPMAKATTATMMPVAKATTTGRSWGRCSGRSRACTTATTTMMPGDCRLLTAQQGDPDDREENRDA
jgi:hypothetical protein